MPPFKQTRALSNIVLPLMIAGHDDNQQTSTPKELIGTGFLIGNRGFALTAAHVIDQLQEAKKSNTDLIVTHIFNQHGVFPFQIVQFEKHPTEDIGVVQIGHQELTSWLELSKAQENSSCPYVGWGYPKEIAEELKFLERDPPLRPSLIYTEGYIRRIIETYLSSSIYVGSKFYEVSDLGGPGYSGSPIINKNSIREGKWQVIGVYIGEKEGAGAPVGYAVRIEAVADWVPKILGRSIFDEAAI